MKRGSFIRRCVVVGIVLLLSLLSLSAFGQAKRFKFFLACPGAPHPFWAVFENGMKDAAKLCGAEAVIQYSGGDDQKQVDMVYTAIAQQADGIGVNIQNDTIFDIPVKKALAAGIPVVAFNTDDSQHAAGNARLAYIGQDFVAAGYAIGKYMADMLPSGCFVACPVEVPGAVYAIKRYEGVKKAFDEKGIKTEVVDAGATSLPDTLQRVESYLLGHPEVKAVCAMGGMPHEMTPKALEYLKMKNVLVGGFDVSAGILDAIRAGKSVAAVDQQGYMQGFYTVMQLYLAKFGITPADINTGSAIIDKSNLDSIAKVIGKYR